MSGFVDCEYSFSSIRVKVGERNDSKQQLLGYSEYPQAS